MSAPASRLGDRYEVGDLIGRGGMADVHRALDTVTGTHVAVKMLRDVTDVDAQRFADEARLLSTLDHPHIVTLLGAGVTDDRPWIALELIEGRTLGDVMADGAVGAEELRQIGADVASGLAHAHSRGVVHRDVKPSNIVLRADGSATLTDFGIARLADATSGLTLTGHTIGTAAYLSPEQVRGDQVTGAGDVYALGLVLLEAITGTRAYEGPPMEAALARLHRAPLIPTSLPPGWPGLLAAMTAFDVEVRPVAAEVAARLDAEGPPVAAAVAPMTTTIRTPVPPAGPTPAPAAVSDLRRVGLVAVAAVLSVVVVLAAARGIAGEAPAAAQVTSPVQSSTSTGSPTAAPSRTPSAQRDVAVSSDPTTAPAVQDTAATTKRAPGSSPTSKPARKHRAGTKTTTTTTRHHRNGSRGAKPPKKANGSAKGKGAKPPTKSKSGPKGKAKGTTKGTTKGKGPKK